MNTTEPTTLRPPSKRKKKSVLGIVRGLTLLASTLAVLGVGLWAFGAGDALGLTQPKSTLKTVGIDQGDIRIYVTESGTLESSVNATVKCQVEALIGQVGGQQGAAGQGGARGGMGGAGGARGGGGAGGGGQPAPVMAKGTAKGGAGGTAKGGAGGAGGMGGSGATASLRPQIQSFTMMILPHQPLRGATNVNGANAAAKNRGGAMGAMGGNRGGGMPVQEKAGSTRVLSLVPEGKRVTKGEIVCELDSAAFRDELQAQLIRWEQAKSWVDQAEEILRVSQISLREYRDGIYLRDLQQCDKYIEICETQLNQSQVSLKWSKEMTGKGLLSPSQLRAAEYGEEQMHIALDEAKRMRKRLVTYSAPKILVNLEAKIAAVRSDLLAQQGAFQLEDDRKRKIEKMIELCTLRAPGDGMVAYARDSSGMPWAPTVTPMMEGVTVRQGQTILLLPDPNNMMVKVRVNESKMSQVYTGQKAQVLVEAFPDKPLTGTVTAVTAIPAQANGPDSGVKFYYANVTIEGGFEGLRTGLSARVSFFVASKSDVARIPLQSVRWVNGATFAAIPVAGQVNGFEWRSIELGLLGATEAEVVTGLKKGELVIANPESLPAPPAALIRSQVTLAPPTSAPG